MSCLFRSLAFFLKNINTDELREIITDYISKDPVLIEPNIKLSTLLSLDNKRLNDYTESMSRSSTWGGAIEIKTFCEIFKIKVYVLVIEEGRYIEFIPSREENNGNIIKISWNGYHYEPLR